MKIEETVRGDVVIIEPKGRLTVETEEQFTEAVRRHLDAGRTSLVLNLANVPLIDSCGLGAMTQGHISARRRGGDLRLMNVGGRNLQLLTVTKLVTVFETYDSAEEAALSFGAKSAGAADQLSARARKQSPSLGSASPM